MNEQLKMRHAEYIKEVRGLWLTQFPVIAAACIVIVFGMIWGMVKLTGAQPFNADWRIVAACVSLALMIPPIKLLYPERPTEESVAHDQVLNALGRQLSSKQK